ncbi:glycosyltransferase family 39 protein [Patescibacteria group bacterium]
MTRKTLKIINITLLTLIIIGAFWVRSFNIENAPSGIYPDEAVNGMDALKAYESGEYQWFYTDNNGREGLYINIIAFAYKLFGVNTYALKFASILFGTLTVWGTYLLTKQLFRSARSGLITAYLTAFSFWSINFSRIGFRAIMLPAVITLSSYFLFRGIKTKKYIHFISAGLIFGIGLHTYIAFRITPAILGILFIALWITKKDFIKDYWKQALVFAMAAFITMTPMINDFYQNPEHLGSRSGSISIFNPEMNQGHLVQTAAKSLGLSLVKYNFWGDQNWRHNYPPYPVLHPLLGITFIIGLIYVIIKFFHLLHLRFKHKVRDRKFYVYSFILAWFFGMLAPEFLSAEGLPHALRAIGTLPVTYIIATIPILWILGKTDQLNHTPRIATYSIIIILLLSIGIFNTAKYHVFWANNPKQASSFEVNLVDASAYLKTLPDEKQKFILAENMQRIPIKLFNFHKPNTNYVHPHELDEFIKNNVGKNYIFILTDKQTWVSDKLLEAYPELELEKHSGKFGESFWTLK